MFILILEPNITSSFNSGMLTEHESVTSSESSNICWRIVNKEGDVFRRPQEGWGISRIYIPVTAPKGKHW